MFNIIRDIKMLLTIVDKVLQKKFFGCDFHLVDKKFMWLNKENVDSSLEMFLYAREVTRYKYSFLSYPMLR